MMPAIYTDQYIFVGDGQQQQAASGQETTYSFIHSFIHIRSLDPEPSQ
jgi:hypothetical protein